MTQVVHEGEVGTVITLQAIENGAVVNITGGTNFKIFARTPSGTVKTWTASIITAASGTFGYTTTATSDLDEEGMWLLQGKFTLSGWTGYALKSQLDVRSALA